MRRSPQSETAKTNNINKKQALFDCGEQSEQEKNKMKKKARTTLIIAGLIMAILLAGKIDNDTAEQNNQPRQNCTWITTPDGAGSCR